MSRGIGERGRALDDIALERQREEILSGGSYRSLEELDRERERKRQELYLEEKQRERGQTQQGAGRVGSGYKSLGDMDREMARKGQELSLDEKQRQRGQPEKADMIEVLDEKDLPPPAAAPARATTSGVRSMLPSWVPMSSAPAAGTTAKPKPTSEADQRLQHAAKEMSEALVLKAGELKDSAVHMTSSLGKKYGTYLPARFGKIAGAGTAEWEQYGRKMDSANRLLVKAERRTNEARNAPPSQAAELYLKANKSRQKALQKAMSAQALADKMKKAIDDKLYEIQRGVAVQRDIWELYGATRMRAQELLDRSEALLREANATHDKSKAAELHNDSIHIRKKALRKAKKAQKFAEEIQRQSQMRVEELRQRSTGSGSGSSSSSSGAGVGSY